MKILIPLACASSLLVAACARSAQDSRDAKTPAAAQSMTSSTSVYNYRCKSGEPIAATYLSTDSATVQYKSRNYTMKIAVSASGARYVGGGLEWWTKGSGPGSEGTLFRHLADGTSGEILETCTAI